MLDLLGTLLLAALAVVVVATMASAGMPHGVRRGRLAWAIATWFVAAAVLGATGAFASPRLPVGIGVGIAVFLPLLVASAAVARTRGFGLPMTALVGLHIGRLLGAAFLLLHLAGRLPATFAHSAGWGDIATGALAIPLVWAIRQRVAGWRWYTAAWNALGIADLLAAVTLGVGSAPGFMLRFIHEAPGSGAIVAFPWVLVPAFFVPFFLLAHVAIFAGLAGHARMPARDVERQAA